MARSINLCNTALVPAQAFRDTDSTERTDRPAHWTNTETTWPIWRPISKSNALSSHFKMKHNEKRYQIVDTQNCIILSLTFFLLSECLSTCVIFFLFVFVFSLSRCFRLCIQLWAVIKVFVIFIIIIYHWRNLSKAQHSIAQDHGLEDVPEHGCEMIMMMMISSGLFWDEMWSTFHTNTVEILCTIRDIIYHSVVGAMESRLEQRLSMPNAEHPWTASLLQQFRNHPVDPASTLWQPSPSYLFIIQAHHMIMFCQ